MKKNIFKISENFKYIFSMLVIVVCTSLCFADDDLTQNQVFSWKPVKNASKYEIFIEILENNEWETVTKSQTRNTKYEIMLKNGNYRLEISAFNKLGRKASTSDKVYFTLNNEFSPELYGDFFKTDSKYNSLIYIIEENLDKPEIINIGKTEEAGLNNSNASKATGASNDSSVTESFSIKGENVFQAETKFYMEPAAFVEGTVNYPANSKRARVPLEILSRDRLTKIIELAFNPVNVYSGYYNITAENPDGKKGILPVLFISDRPCAIDEMTFEYDENYKVRTVTVNPEFSQPLNFNVSNYDSKYSFILQPVSEGIPYPFASQKARDKVKVDVSHVMEKTNADSEFNMQVYGVVNGTALQTGYYRLCSVDAGNVIESILLLVKMNVKEEKKPEILKIEAEHRESENRIIFTVRGNNLDDAKLYLLSQFSTETGKNEKIPVTFLNTERKLTGVDYIYDAEADKITDGYYAVIAESDVSSNVQYIEIKKNKKVSLEKEENTAEIQNLFIAPENYEFKVNEPEEISELTVNIGQEVTDIVPSYKMFAPFIDIDFMLEKRDESINLGVSSLLPVFCWKFINIKTGFDVNLLSEYKPNMFGAKLQLEFCPQSFTWLILPFGGLGVDYSNVYDEIKNNFSVNAYAGIKLFQFLTFKYVLNLVSPLGMEDGISYFYDYYTLGFRIDIRQKNYKKIFGKDIVSVARIGPVNCDECGLNKQNVLSIDFGDGITELKNFSGFECLKTVSLPQSLKVLGENCFADNPLLDDVVIPGNVEKISKGAFKNYKGKSTLIIPSSVKCIEEGAFEGIAECSIYLKWSDAYDSVRDLSGLKDVKTTIYHGFEM